MLEFDCVFQYADGFQLDGRLTTGSGCTVLLGPSGAGKTSILSLVAGLLKPERGRIAVDQRVLFDSRQQINIPIHKRGIGLVTQSARLFPHMSVRSNLEFGRRFRHPGFQEIDFDELIDVLELRPLLGRYPETLSGGQASRVALGRALASRPGLLLMDEPLASLDTTIKHQILDYLHAVIGQWNVPTIFVTHDRAEADRIGDRILQVDQGQVKEPIAN